jgi:hypothetical protein
MRIDAMTCRLHTDHSIHIWNQCHMGLHLTILQMCSQEAVCFLNYPRMCVCFIG